MKILQNIFKKKLSEQDRRMEAELAYRTQSRAFQRYEGELDGTVRRFRQLAVDAENAGQHAGALRAARFTRQLESTREKVAGVRQHFEMMHAMSGASDVMLKFMDSCKQLGCDLTRQIDIDALGAGELSLEDGLGKLNFLSDKLEQAFDTIENSLSIAGDDAAYADAEDERALAEICKDASAAPVPAPAPAEPAAQPLPESLSGSLRELNRKFEAVRT